MTKKQKKTLKRIILAAVILGVLILLTEVAAIRDRLPFPESDVSNRIVMILLFLIPYLIVGYDILVGAAKKIRTGHFLDEVFLMMIATVGAFAVGEYPEAPAVMLFYQVGELFQSIAVGKSRKSISDMMDICPDSAIVLRDGEEIEVDPSEVEPGETVLVKPGEKVPIDGVILEGTTSLNTAALTGESVPVDRTVGDKIFSGSINLSKAVKMQTTAAYEDSTVSKILELVENSMDKKARSEKFITRFARIYTPCVVIAAVLIALVCALFTSLSVGDSIYRGLIFLVVSCPCALVVSVPLSFFGGIGAASKQGILVKGSNYLEALSNINTIVLDKTGTLTEGSFAVDAIHPNEISEDELLDIAALAESRSNHPVAESIIKAHGKHIDASRIGEVEEIAGKGIRAVIDGRTYFVGNGALMSDIGAGSHECHLPGTIVHIARANAENINLCNNVTGNSASSPLASDSDVCEYLGHIVINDIVKKDSKEALSSLRRVGVKRIVMLTGDNEKVAEKVSKEVGVDSFYAGLLPAGKVEKLEELLLEHGSESSEKSGVAFVGDGINDAPVLTRADVGIAMGALGSDAAIEAADIVLMDDNLKKIPVAVRIARQTLRIVKENIVFSLVVKIGIMILGALGLADMKLAVFGDVGVLVLAILNALRVHRIKA
ncbi:MAG: heavy metal translocating P-type ATPase [Clostridiales bacterium]|nr:heavy metal translocating P-type ATPase [Clostridiales bacterium]